MTAPKPRSSRQTFGMTTVQKVVNLTVAGLLLLLIGLAGGMVLERYVLQGASQPIGHFPDLEAVSNVIDDNYYYRPTSAGEANALDREMEQQAIFGALSTLDDEYTRYLSADQSQTAQEDLEGRYGGTGIDIGLDGDLVVVTNVVPESPAENAGVLRGDVIDEIDSRIVDAIDVDRIVRDLRGDIGTEVGLSMIRPSTGEAYEISLVREEIVVPAVTFRIVPETTYAWLRITIFGDQTLAEVDAAIAQLESTGATGIILDLRGNGGGWVTSAQGVLSRFLDSGVGPAMYEDTMPGRGGEEPMPILTDKGAERTDLPMVVLVDRGTASAAEIVAGALKDYNRALIIGEQTFGKGSVQRIFGFSDGASLRVTVAEWFTPSRGRIQEQGIRPDLEVSLDAHGVTDGDPMLDTAVMTLDSGRSRQTDLPGPPASPVSSPIATPTTSSRSPGAAHVNETLCVFNTPAPFI